MVFPDQLALRSIRFYQRYLSPHKGFTCAHAAVHGGESCSAAVARIIREDGVLTGKARIMARFAACRSAYAGLNSGAFTALGTQSSGPRVRGLCCCGPIPIPFRCG